MFLMDTQRLKYFSMVAELGSLTKASEVLGISHSGLSKAISVLEEETQLKLFKPMGRGLEITEEGKWFYTKAQEILKVESEIFSNFKPQSVSTRVGLPEILGIFCVDALAKEVEGPLTVVEVDVGQAENKILGGELDFAVVFTPHPKTGLDYIEVTALKFASFLREDLLKGFSLADIPFAVPYSNLPANPLGFKTRDGWPTEIPRNCQFVVSDFSMALELFRSGQCAVYMPEFIAELEEDRSGNKNKFLRIAEHKKVETERKVFLVKSKDIEESRAMKKLAKILRGLS